MGLGPVAPGVPDFPSEQGSFSLGGGELCASVGADKEQVGLGVIEKGL